MNYLNKRLLKNTVGLLALLMLSYACTDNFSSINTNPNEPSQAATPFLLTSSQKNLADNYSGEFELGYFGNLYSQYWSQNQYTDESQYAFREGVVNDIWEDYYTALNTLQEIIRLNNEFPERYASYGDNNNQIAIAKILQAWTYQTLTDIYGDIPFEEALQGGENPSPAYNTQEEVYTGLLTMLTEASNSIDVDGTGFTSGDIFYEGDMAKWKKFANSLKMRVAIRIADQKPAVAQTAIQEAVSAGVFEDNEDNAEFGYLTSVPNNNPINEAYKDRDDFAASKPLIDLMKNYEDPRISAYAAQARADSVCSNFDCYEGFPYGMDGGRATTYKNENPWSRPGTLVREADFPAIFMLYDEVLFTLAEAKERGFLPTDPTTAAEYYDDAIDASMEYWGVTNASAITNYKNNVPYNSSNYKQVLGEQKWLALYMQGVQGWAEWRRLDFSGVLTPPVDGKLVDFPAPIAVRYPYPQDEENLNRTNLQEAIDRQGPDNQGTKVWWDVN